MAMTALRSHSTMRMGRVGGLEGCTDPESWRWFEPWIFHLAVCVPSQSREFLVRVVGILGT